MLTKHARYRCATEAEMLLWGENRSLKCFAIAQWGKRRNEKNMERGFFFEGGSEIG